MNERLKRHIQDTINILRLSKPQAEYLKQCMEMAYAFGQRDQLEEDHKSTMEIIGEIGKK